MVHELRLHKTFPDAVYLQSQGLMHKLEGATDDFAVETALGAQDLHQPVAVLQKHNDPI